MLTNPWISFNFITLEVTQKQLFNRINGLLTNFLSMTKHVFNRIFKIAKYQSVLLGLLGVAAGILYAFGGLIIDSLVSLGWITSNETPGLSYGTILAFGALIGMPVIFAFTGYVLGLVEGVLYTLSTTILKKTGLLLDFDH